MVIISVVAVLVSIVIITLAGMTLITAIAMGIDYLMDWIENRRLARIDRAEAELDRTQEQLRSTMLQLADALGQEAHEARKALIRESFLASGRLPPKV